MGTAREDFLGSGLGFSMRERHHFWKPLPRSGPRGILETAAAGTMPMPAAPMSKTCRIPRMSARPSERRREPMVDSSVVLADSLEAVVLR